MAGCGGQNSPAARSTSTIRRTAGKKVHVMSFLGGGAECGPSNPLATLGKRLGQDNGLQRDRYGPAAAGLSGANAAMPAG
ncbi:hypothetical protein V8E36_001167 [Tilletia maclaganii]